MKQPTEFEQLARDWTAAFAADAAALASLNAHYEREFTHQDVKAEIWRRVYSFRQRSSKVEANYLALDEARLLTAQLEGFGNWDALLEAAASGTGPPGPWFDLDEDAGRIGPKRRLTGAEWDRLIDVMRERRVRAVDANGQMTDRALRRIAGLEHVRELRLGGSRELTDAGLLAIGEMPWLEVLDLSEYPGGKLTDTGLAVLARLPELREFEMTWQSGITDAGMTHLRHCQRLESVNLMGSPTGDGAVAALAGMTRLLRLSTGRLTTDEGIRSLREIPGLWRMDGGGLRLLLDGPVTDGGLGALQGMEGLAELDLFWHTPHITGEGFSHLPGLPNLKALGCDGRLSGDAAMGHIARIPKLRRLRCQESAATEDGFVALGASGSIEEVWGRVCENFGDRAFLAFSNMPRLEELGIGLAKVSPGTLDALPRFPALRRLTPIGLTDSGFTQVGQCAGLEKLSCMYCRETTDEATERIAGLRLKSYYAGLTRITDRSLEILGAMETLEELDFYECQGVTDAGLPFLASLPRLREVSLAGLPRVTAKGTEVFPPGVRVRHSH